MTDFRVLNDAFAELEQRADAASAGMPLELPPRARSRPTPRLVPVAVAVVVVAGLATGTALLVPGGDTTTQTAAPAASTTTVAATAAPTSEKVPFAVPADSAELAEKLRAVLGDTATFTVTESGPGAVVAAAPPSPPGSGTPDVTRSPGTPVGAAIIGLLTASGRTGGFDLAFYPGNPGGKAQCDILDPTNCTVRDLPDGSSLAAGRTALEGSPNGVTNMVHRVRPDGVTFIIHVSNQLSPKGAGDEIAPLPPLTLDQLVAIAASDLW